jgi:D-amino peptidase
VKVYISADIEGIAGIAHWDEANRDHPAWAAFRDRMTEHVVAACEGAFAGGATEVWVKDAHASARNIDATALPPGTRLIRGWSQHPLMMVQEIDGSFDAVCFVGYHAKAGSGANPLAHTLSASKIMRMRINGQPTSEYHLYAQAAGTFGVPAVFLSGDETICATAKALNPAVTTVTSMYGRGESTVSRHPDAVRDDIRAGIETALGGDLRRCVLSVQGPFELEVEFHKAGRAYRASHYPGASLVDDHIIRLTVDDYGDVLRALVFVV